LTSSDPYQREEEGIVVIQILAVGETKEGIEKLAREKYPEEKYPIWQIGQITSEGKLEVNIGELFQKLGSSWGGTIYAGILLELKTLVELLIDKDGYKPKIRGIIAQPERLSMIRSEILQIWIADIEQQANVEIEKVLAAIGLPPDKVDACRGKLSYLHGKISYEEVLGEMAQNGIQKIVAITHSDAKIPKSTEKAKIFRLGIDIKNDEIVLIDDCIGQAFLIITCGLEIAQYFGDKKSFEEKRQMAEEIVKNIPLFQKWNIDKMVKLMRPPYVITGDVAEKIRQKMMEKIRIPVSVYLHMPPISL
jgi:hypothetical protein